MAINRSIINASALLVVFSLLFLGMHIPLHDNSTKPKPRSKAVLNLFAKTASTTAAATKLDHSPPAFFLQEPHADQMPLCYVVAICNTPYANSPSAASLRLPNGRSPPRC